MFGYGPMMGGFGGWGYGSSWGIGLLGMVIQLAVIIAVLFLIYFLWNRAWQKRDFGAPAHKGANEILAERFARGEISEDEYQRMKELL